MVTVTMMKAVLVAVGHACSVGGECNVYNYVYYYTIIWGRLEAESSVSHSVLHLPTSIW